MPFRRAALLVPIVLALACGAQDVATQKAQDAATAWLALTDRGEYGASWDAAAAAFQAAMPRSSWETALRGARAPLGGLRTRTFKDAKSLRNPPGAPDGDYVMIQFQTSFENKASAVETVTPMKQKDGTWKVSGYFIR